MKKAEFMVSESAPGETCRWRGLKGELKTLSAPGDGRSARRTSQLGDEDDGKGTRTTLLPFLLSQCLCVPLMPNMFD